MVFTSLQVCMDSSDWLQGTLHEESGMDSSSSPSGGDMLTCSRPLIERRLRPQHDQPLKCPRCESTHTKFCYYNNYSLSQPRYFCKTCRRYWTKGGTLRNIPVGGGCRKNKKSSSNNSNNNNGNNSNNNKKPPPNYNDDVPHNHHHHHSHHLGSSSSSRNDPTDLHLAFSPEAQISHLSGLLGGMQTSGFANPSCSNFLDMSGKFNSIGACSMGENPARPPIDFLESKVASYENFMVSTGGDEQYHHHLGGHVVGDHMSSVQGLCVQYNGMIPANVDGHLSGHFMAENCQRLMQMPYDQEQETGGHDEDHHHHHHAMVDADVKPSPKLLTLEWQDQGGVGSNCCDAIGSNNKMISSGGGAFGYFNGLGSSWGGIMSDYSSSAAAAATNPLV